MLEIRAYRPEDQRRIIDLWQACGLVVPHNDPVRDIQRKLSVHPQGFLVGAVGGRIVASCMVGFDGHRGWINYLAVAPSERRRGYASRMVEKAEHLLRTAGCPKINIQIRTGNEEVLAFYQRLGFSTDAVISMGKRLERDDPSGEAS